MISSPRLSPGKRLADREAVTLRDNVLAIVAHDLRSPINTITMAAELLRETDADERQHHFLDIIVKAANQADALIRDLVDVARLEAGHFRVQTSTEPLAYLLESVTEMFAPLADERRILLACDVENLAGVAVRVDTSRFVQLLSNLISNAIKFTEPGGNVMIDAVVEGSMVRVNVHDSGMGISDEELPHVFERFWQADHHHRAGAGLGLAIAKGIVEAHGGDIWVVSTEGHGSIFTFTLPIAS